MADKLVLSMLVLAVIAAVAAIAATVEIRRDPGGQHRDRACRGRRLCAVLSRAGATVADIVPTLVGTVCGVVVLRLLLSGRFTDAPSRRRRGYPRSGRRLSLATLGFLRRGALSGVAGVVLTRLTSSVAGDRNAFALPRAAVPRRCRRRCSRRAFAAVVRHPQRRVLPDRHRVVAFRS